MIIFCNPTVYCPCVLIGKLRTLRFVIVMNKEFHEIYNFSTIEAVLFLKKTEGGIFISSIHKLPL